LSSSAKTGVCIDSVTKVNWMLHC